MPHITFVHGIGNKPPAGPLLTIWVEALARSGGIDIGSEGITATMVYWADVLYPQPLANLAPEESLVAAEAELLEFSGVQVPLARSTEEAQFIAMLAAKVGGALAADELRPPDSEGLTEIPLPWEIKKRLLEAFLRDAHHYLFDVDHSPRPGVRYHVRQEIRRRFVEAVSAAPSDGNHLIVGHSLGSVIAYDCLKNVEDCRAVDAFVTIGSPLGLSEVQDRLGPGYSPSEGFPTQKLGGDWANLADHFDPICGLDPKIAADYRRGGAAVVTDKIVRNQGWWRHAVVQYLARTEVRAAVRASLG
jgi:hypothetical protein